MKRNKHRLCRRDLLSVILTVFSLTLMAVTILADEHRERGDSVRGAACSISVDFSVENHTHGIEGASFTILQVLRQKGGRYQWNEEVLHTGMRRSEILSGSGAAAAGLKTLNKTGDGTIVSDQTGKLKFDGLTEGVWLVYQSGAEGEAKDYDESLPCLVTLPQRQQNTLLYDVTLYPKTRRNTQLQINMQQNPDLQKNVYKTSVVATGDDAMPVQYVLMMISALGLILISALCLLLFHRERGLDPRPR